MAGKTSFIPSAPMGYHTFFVRSDAGGRFVSRENVLTMKHFARIQAGLTTEDVLRSASARQFPSGPSDFKARDELVWEWRYCDDWNETARFNVLFDGTSERVRSTLTATERSRNLFDRSGLPSLVQPVITITA